MPNARTSMTRLYAFCVACFLFALVYGALSATPAPLMQVLLHLGPPVAVATWLVRDCRRCHVSLPYDADLLFYMAWPVLIPWFALHTRGKAGWSLVGQLYALALAGGLGDLMGTLVGHAWIP